MVDPGNEADGVAVSSPPDRDVSRRLVLQTLGSAAVLNLAAPSHRFLGSLQAAQSDSLLGDSALDDVLRQIQAAEPASVQGLSTHAPMAVEAMCAMGLGEQASQWFANFRGPTRDLPVPHKPIDSQHWKEALGPDAGADSWEAANTRWADWTKFFTQELSARDWKQVLDIWAARLAPGMSGAATHGIIRTSHAVRALARKGTPERQAELARGLAYWASAYEELPAAPRRQPAFDSFAAALDEVPLYRDAFGISPQGRNIVEVLRHVRQVDGFDQVRDAVAVPEDLSTALSALTATFARVYLRYGTQKDTLAFIHAVTGPSSLRRLLPHLAPRTARRCFPYAWQTAAAVFSAYVEKRELNRPEESKLAAGELTDKAILSGDAHAIKFTEVMLAEYQCNPDPIYLAAAEDAVGRL